MIVKHIYHAEAAEAEQAVSRVGKDPMKLNKKLKDVGEQVNTERIKAENRQLRAAVKRRTVELERKNLELEIETALEKVRAVAMGMKEPAGMLAVCKTISLQLKTLGVKEIRNVQTAIFYPVRGTYMNYEYYAKHKKTFVTETTYTNNKIHKSFALKMLKGEGEVFTTHIRGKKVKDWLKDQKTTNVFIDKYLQTAASLSYYWYSLGPVAMGISSYIPLSDGHLNLFKRFRKVFELAYRRYLDIAKAEAQAREAQIETALERIRARAMAMHSSDELMKVANSLREQMGALGQAELETSVIHIYEEGSNQIWASFAYRRTGLSSGKITSGACFFPKDSSKVAREIMSMYNAGKTEFTIDASGAKLAEFWRVLRTATPRIARRLGPSDKRLKRMYSHFTTFRGGALVTVTYQPPTEEVKSLQRRAAVVFDMAYRRYLDLQKAEAQARESQIQLALERVRARTMAMQNSEELTDTSSLLFEQFEGLGVVAEQISIAIVNEDPQTVEIYATLQGKKFESSYEIKISKQPAIRAIYNAFKSGRKSTVLHLKGNELRDYNAWRNKLRGASLYPIEIGQADHWYIHMAFFSKGLLSFSTHDPAPDEAMSLLERFAETFNLTYARFLDLRKAEAQAREAQIEAALERVRSRSMGMQKSEELKEVIQVVYQQFVHLKINVDHAGFVVDYTPKGDWHFWIADQREIPSKITHPYFDSVWAHQFNEAKEKGIGFFATNLNFEEKNKFYQDLFKFIPDVPKESLDFYFNCPGLGASTVLLDNVGLYIENFSGTPYKDEENKILIRFGKVFQQTYTRFLDLQKAEAQAREAQIEAALERVRSRSMAMHRSDDLLKVIAEVADQLRHLGLYFDVVTFAVNSEKHDYDFWLSATALPDPVAIHVPYLKNQMFDRVKEARKKGLTFHTDIISSEENREWVQHMLKYANLNLPKEVQTYILRSGYARSIALMSQIQLILGNYRSIPYSDDENNIIKRFAAVFDQAYTRFLDLQKAEAQAREAQIEAALERVRSKAMAMHNSSDLSATVSAVFSELRKLGVETIRTGVALYSKEQTAPVYYASTTSDDDSDIRVTGSPDPSSHSCLALQYEAWLKQQNYFPVLKGEELKKYYEVISIQQSAHNKHVDPFQLEENGYYMPFSEGNFYAWSLKPYTPGEINILSRFKAIVDLTFRRYFDLQKAEAQARESQIQLALERIRARTMAMHKSEELSETSFLLFEQLKELGEVAEQMSITIFNEQEGVMTLYSTVYGSKWKETGRIPLEKHSALRKVQQARKENRKFVVIDLSGEELADFNKFKMKYSTQYKSQDDTPKDRWVMHYAFFSKGALAFSSHEPRPPETIHLLERFAGVFDLTYTRFLDLQKAEAQAREAQTEAALERVRAKAMAMHRSDDLTSAVATVFEELDRLGFKTLRCGIGIFNILTRKVDFWTTSTTDDGNAVRVTGDVLMAGHPLLEGVFEAWQRQQDYFYVLQGEDLARFYEVMSDSQLKLPESAVTTNAPTEALQYYHCAMFPAGGLYAFRENEFSEDAARLMRRFAEVFHLTFTRHQDLVQAEARAREAERQASLDRVRAEIASMRTSEDLNRITPVIWRELRALDVPFIRCGVFIIDEGNKNTQVYLTTPGGKSLGVLDLPFDANGLTSNTVEHWKRNQVYKEHWNKEEFVSFTNSMMQRGQLQSAETYQDSASPPESLHLHFVPFTQGMLYVGDVSPLSAEKLDLVKTLAEVFSVAYARYEDFRKLEEAKNKIELTLNELNATQAQLVQQEKLASLGQLTAGIAHEIKNPLNFVSNFSSVSVELVDEVLEVIKSSASELGKGDAPKLLADIKTNLAKIMEHGARADSIVRSMLQHSRGGTRKMEPTDVNTLIKEFVNLAFHGMRASKNPINVLIELALDESIGKVLLIAEDFSRVILNICQNAFDAMREKRTAGNEKSYLPKLIVRTHRQADRVIVQVEDNGPGVPEEIKDKVLQPFFTTKKGTQGTGLGLSITNDIVKAHGGEMEIDTNEGGGATITIELPTNIQDPVESRSM